MFRSGDEIGHYTLIEKLGEGIFGEVWLAERRTPLSTERYALRLPSASLTDPEMIWQEGPRWQRLGGHRNVLPVVDVGEYDGQVFIAGEYAPEGSLEQWLKRNGRMAFEEAVGTVIEVLEGLEFLHSHQIIHGDLTPSNILFKDGTPRLADFGLSRVLQPDTTGDGRRKSLRDLRYLAPETLEGRRSFQTDIWSVGVILYELLTGTLPPPQTMPDSLSAILTPMPPMPEFIPSELARVIAKALAGAPENRYRTAAEMRADLFWFRNISVVQKNCVIIGSAPPEDFYTGISQGDSKSTSIADDEPDEARKSDSVSNLVKRIGKFFRK
jgi:eukaryotic-like serine/threonine-protein kinase